MMAFPSMLLSAAVEAGMKIPDLTDSEEFDADSFPHFHIFCNVQLYRPITWGEHWENAKIVAEIPEEKLRTITLQDLLDMGLHYQS